MIQLLGDRVLIKKDDAKRKTASGIIIPETAIEKSLQGTVRAVGPGRNKEEKMTIKINDKVIYSEYAGTEIEIENEKLLLMRETDIYAIIDEKTE